MRYLTLAISIHLIGTHLAAEPAPQRTVVTKGTVVKVYDGDTIHVQMAPPIMKIRFLDCWAPEIRGKGVTDAQKIAGYRSRDHLRTLLPLGSECTFRVKTFSALDKSFTFGRILAKVWNKDGVDISEEQVRSGHATFSRGE